MNSFQEDIITDNMDVVKWSIYYNIGVNEQIQGLGYEDLYQVGCLALCEAAETYDKSTKFRTYAKTVVRNRLIDHCRAIKRRQDKIYYLESQIPDADEKCYAKVMSSTDESIDSQIYMTQVEDMLQKTKSKYSGVTLKGIEAIEFKLKGYSGIEIAVLYGVKPNLLGAWISRAKQKLRQDDDFMAVFSEQC